MNRIQKGLCMIILSMVALIPVSRIEAKEISVTTQDELKSALADKSIDTIVLGNNINTTEKINVLRPVTMDGNGKTLTYVGTFGKTGSRDNTVWGGIYVLQFYKTTGVLKNIKLTGGNAGLLINGSTVDLIGTLDVSGNGFGGIELGQGADVTTTPTIDLNDTGKIVNTTESKNRPTLWVPDNTDGANITIQGKTTTLVSGEELTLAELYALTENQNPETGDTTLYFVVLASISLGILLVTITKRKQYQIIINQRNK